MGQESLGHFLWLGVLCRLGWCQHLCLWPGYGVGKCMAGRREVGLTGTGGVIFKFAVAPSLNLFWGKHRL